VRALRALLITVLLVAVLALVAGEVVLRPLAERAVARDVQDRYQLDQRPSVHLGGFPFLVRVAMGHLPSATGRLRNTIVEGLTLEAVELRLKDVRFDTVHLLDGDGNVRADAGQATVIVEDTDLSAYLAARGLPFDVRFSPGQVTVGGTVTVAGVQVRVEASGDLAVTGGQLTFSPTSIQAVGSRATLAVPQSVLDAFRSTVAFSVPLPEVAGVQLSELEIGPGMATLRAELADYLLTS
jgi:LmeA-like phospholipid-binding